jgi:hypothetical protein
MASDGSDAFSDYQKRVKKAAQRALDRLVEIGFARTQDLPEAGLAAGNFRATQWPFIGSRPTPRKNLP